MEIDLKALGKELFKAVLTQSPVGPIVAKRGTITPKNTKREEPFSFKALPSGNILLRGIGFKPSFFAR